MHKLRSLLKRIHKNSYKIYKSIRNTYRFDSFDLVFDHIQADPFAPPSKLTIVVPMEKTGFPATLYDSTLKSVAFRDSLARIWARLIRKHTGKSRGSGNSGVWAINYGNQKVLDRNSVLIRDGMLHIRLMAGLPAQGRRIDALAAQEMFFKELISMCETGLVWERLDQDYFYKKNQLKKDQAELRSQLQELGLVSFIANGSVLARKSGIDDTPMDRAIPLQSPPEKEVQLYLADGKKLKGLGIPRGITLITGGGFHGKSTLLNAIQSGIYDHIPGDGREYVVSDPSLVKVRSEDGRSVTGVDISPFIGPLPGGISTARFSTENASGSTSQASNIIESLEMGTTCLLLDEDSSATNFLIRDLRMRDLIPGVKEPITPFIDQVRDLWQRRQVSTVMAIGGSGDYLDVADHVLLMDEYRVKDVTEQARTLVKKYPYAQVHTPKKWIEQASRTIDPSSIDPSKGKREIRVSRQGKGIQFGKQHIDLTAYEHICDHTQYDTIARLLVFVRSSGVLDDHDSLAEGVKAVFNQISLEGWDILGGDMSYGWDYLCQIRPMDVAAAVNRIRSLRIRQV